MLQEATNPSVVAKLSEACGLPYSGSQPGHQARATEGLSGRYSLTAGALAEPADVVHLSSP